VAVTNGRLTSSRFPYLPVTIRLHAREDTVEALLDTGFDGHVVVPPSLVGDAQPPNGHLRWTLADGSAVLAPYYLGTIRVGALGPFPAVVTALGDEPLIGCGIAAHFSITLDHGRRLIVEP
jgi:predicted aspartyl protease